MDTTTAPKGINTNTYADDRDIELMTGVRMECGDAHTITLLSSDGHPIARRTVRASSSLRGEATREDLRWARAHHAEYSVARIRVDGHDRATNAPMRAHRAVVRRAASILRAIELADGVTSSEAHTAEIVLVDRDGEPVHVESGRLGGGLEYATDRTARLDRETARTQAARGAVEVQLIVRDASGRELGESAAPAALRERVKRFRRRLQEST